MYKEQQNLRILHCKEYLYLSAAVLRNRLLEVCFMHVLPWITDFFSTEDMFFFLGRGGGGNKLLICGNQS
jgi:hypothetical protein